MEGRAMWCRCVAHAAMVLAVLSISGCFTTEWVQLRDDPVPFGTARSGCWAQAKLDWPVKNEVAVRTEYVDELERCREEDRSKCDVDGKYNRVKLPKIESYIIDVNERSRDSQDSDCMRGSGWKTVTRWSW